MMLRGTEVMVGIDMFGSRKEMDTLFKVFELRNESQNVLIKVGKGGGQMVAPIN